MSGIPSPLIRINVFLASAGLGSRRAVESLICAGQVTVNGHPVTDLATRVNPAADRVEFGGKVLKPLVHQYVLFHKPTGCACTRQDPHAERTIYDLLPPELRHLAHVGRLDADSEGLLLLSNDGVWAARVTHPRHGVKKIYEVEVKGLPDAEALARMKLGIRDRDELLKVETVEILEKKKTSTRVKVVLREGRKREIRRMFGALHHPVLQLTRVAVGRLFLGDLARGKWRYLTPSEIKQIQSHPIKKQWTP